MCNPMFLAMGVQAVGTGVSAYGSIKSGEANAAYYNFLASQNNKLATDTQEAAIKDVSGIQTQASLTQEQKDREVSKLSGSQRAALAASGVGGGSVTSEDISRDTMTTAGRDAAAIRYNADIKSYQIAKEAELRAQALRSQSEGFGQAGVNATKAGTLNALTSVLGGATSVASNWYNWNQTGAGKKVNIPTRTVGD
jgi:hypothetical protein